MQEQTEAASVRAMQVDSSSNIAPSPRRRPTKAPQLRAQADWRSGDDKRARASALARAPVQQLWEQAQQHVADAGDKPPKPFLQAEKLQHAAVSSLEESMFQQLHAASSDRRKALLISLTAPHSSAYLSILPTQPTYRMADEAMRLAIRKRLGLLPFDQLRDQKCTCPAQTAFASDPDHFHSCSTGKTHLTRRHNNLV